MTGYTYIKILTSLLSHYFWNYTTKWWLIFSPR